jgi:hypothetical protein
MPSNSPENPTSNGSPDKKNQMLKAFEKYLKSFGIELDPEKRQKELKAKYDAKYSPENIKKLKAQAEKVVKDALQKGQHVSTSIPAELEPYTREMEANQNKRVAQANVRMHDALEITQATPAWVVDLATKLQHSPEAMEYLTDYLMLSPDLQNDPKVLYYLTANLASSVRADQTLTRQNEIRNVVKTAIDTSLQKTYEQNSLNNTLLELGSVPTGPFVIYDEAKNVILPGTDAEKTANLKWFLKDIQRQYKALDPESEQAKKLLQRWEEDLARGTFKQLENKKEVTREIDPGQAQPYIERLKEEVKQEEQRYQAQRIEPRVNKNAPQPDFSDENFLSGTEFENDGKKKPRPLADISNDKLRTFVDNIARSDKNTDLRSLAQEVQYLQFLDPNDLNGDDKIWRENVLQKTERYVRIMLKERFIPNPHMIYELQEGENATLARDREFYQRIVKILDNPNEEARRQLNLYDEADWDYFSSIIRGAENGDKLVQHYESLKETIIRLSDMGFWGNNAAGDVESLKKAMDFMDNKFAIEAMSDPWVVAMFQCREQAIKILRDSNDQYVDPSSASFDPKRYHNLLEELTLQFFDQSMVEGSIRDFERDPKTGIPMLDDDGLTFKLSDKPLHLLDVDFDQVENIPDKEKREKIQDLIHNRKLAALRLSNGLGILTKRSVELFAFTRTPNDDYHFRSHAGGDFDNDIAHFSSKVMGGLTRWVNPLSEWMLMYGFGDTLFVPFFNYLVGGDPKSATLFWTMDQCKEAVDIAATGDISLLKKRFGKGVTRLTDMIEGMSFTGGGLSPGSKWRFLDSTMHMSDKDLERTGGSLRLQSAGVKAENDVKELFALECKSKNPSMSDDELKKYVKKEWDAMFKSEKLNPHRKHWEHLVESYKNTYSAWIWVQTVMRNPQGVASAQWADYEDKGTGKIYHGKLRSKIMHEVFNKTDLKNFKINGEILSNLVVERDIASSGTMPEDRKLLMRRVAVVDGDLAAVQRYAMNNGIRPEDIKDEFFNICIKGTYTLTDFRGVKIDEINVERRREQARLYWNMVQREMLGKAVGDAGPGWDFTRWQTELQPHWDNNKKGEPSKLRFTNPENIRHIIENAHTEAGREIGLNQELVEKKLLVHFGTEDCQWQNLDLAYLGERHWSRSGGDFLTSAKTTMKMMQAFHGMVGKPKMEELVKIVQEIGMQGKDYDPKDAAMRASLWAGGINQIYKQRRLGGFPIIGKILPTLGVPMSIAQEVMGAHSADNWSMNNQVKYSDLLAATRVIPEERFFNGMDYGEWTMKKLRKDMGASRILAALEMLIVGYVISAMVVAAAAAAKQTSDEGKERH